MLEIFQYWQVNLVLAIILFVVLYQFYRLLAKESNNSANIPVIVGYIGSIIFIFLMPFFGIKFVTSWHIWALLFLSTLFYAVHDVLKSVGFKKLDVSVVAVFSQLAKVFMIVLGVVIFREKLTQIELFGIILVVLGSALISFKKNKFKINKYIWAIIVASLFFAFAMIIDVGISTQFNLAFYFFILYLIPSILISISMKIKFIDLKKEFFRTKNTPNLFIFASLCSSIGMLLYLLSLRQGQVSIVAPLSSVTVLLNVLAGYIFLKERDDLVKRIIASILVIVGIFLLV